MKALLGIWWYEKPVALHDVLSFPSAIDAATSIRAKLHPFYAEISLPDGQYVGDFSGEGVDQIGKFSLKGNMGMGALNFTKTYDPANSKGGAKLPLSYRLRNDGGGGLEHSSLILRKMSIPTIPKITNAEPDK